MHSLIKAAIAATSAIGVYLLISYRVADDLTSPTRIELEDTPADFGRAFEEVEFRSRRGDVTLDGWYLAGRRGMPVVIFVHGINSTRTEGGMTELASNLNSRGFGALMFDLRGHGQSGGERMTGGWHERMDVLGAFDYLCARGVPSGHIGVLGLSMGAAAAALAAAEEPRIKALTLDCPFARAKELLDNEAALTMDLPRWLVSIFRPGGVLVAERLYDVDVDAIAPEDAMAKIDYPVMVVASPEDERIPPSHTFRVYAAAPKGSSLWIVDNVVHCGAFSEHKELYANRVAEYFLSRL